MFLQNAGYTCFDHENVPEQGEPIRYHFEQMTSLIHFCQ
ncbi:hypothetical protein F383_20875 [Gossypium arboreum]|uniref:Uncharacterized protein n=1 Tax=Gossypium arboreum TaxID=29729 RepID=A0A0B0MMY8_GOSAR|nr:hypothetical protein F383_20875 [Gossypium arboreum]